MLHSSSLSFVLTELLFMAGLKGKGLLPSDSWILTCDLSGLPLVFIGTALFIFGTICILPEIEGCRAVCVLVVVEKSWCVYVCNGLGQVCGWGREAGKSIVVPVLFWPEGRKPWKWGVERRRKKGHSDTVSVIGFEISFLFQSVLVFLKCRVCVINSRVNIHHHPSFWRGNIFCYFVCVWHACSFGSSQKWQSRSHLGFLQICRINSILFSYFFGLQPFQSPFLFSLGFFLWLCLCVCVSRSFIITAKYRFSLLWITAQVNKCLVYLLFNLPLVAIQRKNKHQNFFCLSSFLFGHFRHQMIGVIINISL